MTELLADLPAFLGGHLRLTLLALAVGLVLSLPLGVLATRVRWLERVVMTGASVIQTIPGLALLAVMVPLLAALSLPSIGWLPALIGLSAYSVLPILRNTVTGIRGVDPALIEAARGVGMSDRQRLRRVELPLALPVIVAGVRTASVWVVGTATLSTPVGAPSLGNYIFSGLQTRNDAAVVLGCVAAAGLALALDGLIRLLEWAVSERKVAARNFVLGLFGLAYLGVFAVPLISAWSGPAASERVVIGTKPFTEQYILGELLRGQIEAKTELRPELMPSLGSKVAFDALVAGDVSVYVDYSGTMWTNFMKRAPTADRELVLAELSRWLADEHDVTLVGALGFENAYALALPSAEAERLGVRTIAELAVHAPGWTIAGDYEFFSRPEWARLREVYGLEFEATRTMDSALMYGAVRGGEVEVVSAYSTDGRVAAYELTLLEDPRGAIPPYDAVILINGEAARAHPELVDALGQLVGRVDAPRMREANRAVDLDGRTVEGVAARLLDEL
ncbi:Glycine betaine/carnitine/choline transport system permease protein OpuCB [Enhygromyxa salina]|uniref:Glycine betaine/carnitine/choline transport system permease protein OpuCB n=1 Tax=Enhygromyxa salina TaxID=215803 RepID=A0A2S9XGS1_9BACT|nr:ABC transporter permease/substrate-binding protein [Enhygromyxa salina]PRP92068.1 Glycine betaine/carnitine/choline transport system permease protein OpuCB [Enhygromyxa salina]